MFAYSIYFCQAYGVINTTVNSLNLLMGKHSALLLTQVASYSLRRQGASYRKVPNCNKIPSRRKIWRGIC